MAVTTNQRRLFATLLAGVAASAALSSCSSGWNNQTGSQEAAIDGTSINSALLAIRNAYVAYAEEEGSLSFVAVNPSLRPVRLTNVTVVYPSGKRVDLPTLANQEVPSQGRLQVGPLPSNASTAPADPRASFVAGPALSTAGEKLTAGLSVKLEFSVVAPASPTVVDSQEDRSRFQTTVPLVGKSALSHY